MGKMSGAMKAISLAFVTALAVGPLAPTTANATPTGCRATTAGTNANAQCSGGSGQYRVKADCPLQADQYGAWVSAPGVSHASCKLNARSAAIVYR